ncbi:MAG: protein kinase [Planctomycetes bacterium]|nr:protein kinase [Planctomycetota bacterium]
MVANLAGKIERIGGYNVVAVLGHGAGSTIYAVQQKRDHQLFALKRVVRERPEQQKFVDQVLIEYEVSKAVDHPTIRRCYKVKRVRKFFSLSEAMLVMELVDGRSLVQNKPTNMRELVRVFLAVASGLAAMHKAGYVHADIKPNNILLTDRGEVKIIDLGQACRMGAVKDRIQGTPDYIAPEQVHRIALTGKTDIFNFGATMYWCLTDSHIPTLIPKGGSGEMIRKEDMELRPPVDLNPKVPLGLNSLVLHCLQFLPEDRPESMAEVRSRLETILLKIDREQNVPAQASGK